MHVLQGLFSGRSSKFLRAFKITDPVEDELKFEHKVHPLEFDMEDHQTKKKSSSSGNVVTVADTLFKVLANKPRLKKNVSKQSRPFLSVSEKQ